MFPTGCHLHPLLCCCFFWYSGKTMSFSVFSYPENHQYVILERKELLASGHWFWWEEKHGWYLNIEKGICQMNIIPFCASPGKAIKKLRTPHSLTLTVLWKINGFGRLWRIRLWRMSQMEGQRISFFIAFIFWSTQLCHTYTSNRVLLHRRA